MKAKNKKAIRPRGKIKITLGISEKETKKKDANKGLPEELLFMRNRTPHKRVAIGKILLPGHTDGIEQFGAVYKRHDGFIFCFPPPYKMARRKPGKAITPRDVGNIYDFPTDSRMVALTNRVVFLVTIKTGDKYGRNDF